MKKFVIKLDNLYYRGEGERITSKIPAGGRWHETYTEQSDVTVGIRADAKVIEGYTNLNSHWKRIYDALRYGDLKASRIEIMEVPE